MVSLVGINQKIETYSKDACKQVSLHLIPKCIELESSKNL